MEDYLVNTCHANVNLTDRWQQTAFHDALKVGRCTFKHEGQGKSMVPPHTRRHVSRSLSLSETSVKRVWFQCLK